MRGLVLAAVLALGGCSFVLTRGPGADFEKHPETCTYSANAPALDTTFASLYGLVGLTVAAAPGDASTEVKVAVAGTAGVLVILHVWARFHGLGKISRCREAYRRLQERGGGPIPDL
jgi:hypothetical protein